MTVCNKCDFCEENYVNFETRCGHFFHEVCLKKSFAKDLEEKDEEMKCPNCRSPISDSARTEKLCKDALNGTVYDIKEEDIIPILKTAIEDGRLPYKKIFEKCIELEWKVDSHINKDGSCAIHLAASSGRMDVLEYLLSLGSNIDLLDNKIGTPLHYAAQNGDLEMAKFLIGKGCCYNPVNEEYREVPIHAAIWSKNKELVEFLVKDNRPCHFYRNCQDLTPVGMAVAYEVGFDIVELLYKNGAKDDYSYCFLVASKFGCIKYAKYFLEKGAYYQCTAVDEASALHLATVTNQTNMIHYLLGLGIDVNVKDSKGETPLMYAAKNKEDDALDTLKALINCGADLNLASNSDGWTALGIACIFGNFSGAKVIFEASVDLVTKSKSQQKTFSCLLIVRELLDEVLEELESKDIPILHAICESINYEMLNEFIEKGYDVNTKNYIGGTPLFYANTEEIINKLFEKSVDLNVMNKDGMNAFLKACKDGNKILLDALIKKCGVNCVNILGQNYLHLSIMSGNFDLIGTLIEHGVNVNCFDYNGKNPAGYLPLVFIEKRLNRTYKNYDFHRAIEVLKRAGSMFEPVIDDWMYFFKHEGVIKAYNRAVAQYEKQKTQKKVKMQ